MSNDHDAVIENAANTATEAAPTNENAANATPEAAPTKAKLAMPFCTSRLAATIMEKYRDEWILVVALAISEAQSQIDKGCSYETAIKHADEVISNFNRVNKHINSIFDPVVVDPDSRRHEAALELRTSAAVAIASGQTSDEIIASIQDQFGSGSTVVETAQ